MKVNPIPAQANIRTIDVVARANGNPITSGTVNYYLVAQTGANAGKWFKHSDQTWNVSETICLAMTHKADGHWTATVHQDAWIDEVEYMEYAKESGNLHIPLSYTFRAEPLVEDAVWEATQADHVTVGTTGKSLSDAADEVSSTTTSLTEDTVDVLGVALGKVEYPVGNPLIGARVQVYSDVDAELTIPLFQAITDGDGGFSVIVDNGAIYRVTPVEENFTFPVKRVNVPN